MLFRSFNEGQKSIYDPCPPGYKVPSINGFYFGKSGGHADCVHLLNGGINNISGYSDIIANGYYIYYFGAFFGYEKYHTWMPMAPYYNQSTIALSSTDGNERFAFTWLNAGAGSNGREAYPVIWHPDNNHIHNYGRDTESKYLGGTVRCVKETDPTRVLYTVPEKIVLQKDAGSSFDFGVLTDMSWYIEYNNLKIGRAHV